MAHVLSLPWWKISVAAALLLTCFLGLAWANEFSPPRETDVMPSVQEIGVPGLPEGGDLPALPQGSENVPDLFHAGLRMVTALVVVIGLLLLSFHGVKRFMNSRGTLAGRGAMIQVLATRYLGSKNALSVIDVGGEQFVVGLSPQGISFLTRLGQVPDGGRGGGEGSAFENLLREELDNG